MARRNKVFGIGLMKTGTTTLGRCFDAMGYKHFSYFPKLIRQNHKGELTQTWDVAERFESFEDHPWPSHYQELDRRYPDAKFVLTVRRSSDVWFRSLANHARRRGPTVERLLVFGHGWPLTSQQAHIDFYEAHNQAVADYFADRPDKLLVVCWEDGSNWHDVAAFLGSTVEAPVEAGRFNSSNAQKISASSWLRNTTKYVVLGRLGIDPFRHSGFEEGIERHMGPGTSKAARANDLG